MRTLQSELRDKGLCQDGKRQATKRRQPMKETLSRREVESLMGKYRQTYKRVRGSVRQK